MREQAVHTQAPVGFLVADTGEEIRARPVGVSVLSFGTEICNFFTKEMRSCSMILSKKLICSDFHFKMVHMASK